MKFLFYLLTAIAFVDAAALPGFKWLWAKKLAYFSMIAHCSKPQYQGKVVYCNPDGSLSLGGGGKVLVAGVRPGVSGDIKGYYGGWNRNQVYHGVRVVNNQYVVVKGDGNVVNTYGSKDKSKNKAGYDSAASVSTTKAKAASWTVTEERNIVINGGKTCYVCVVNGVHKIFSSADACSNSVAITLKASVY